MIPAETAVTSDDELYSNGLYRKAIRLETRPTAICRHSGLLCKYKGVAKLGNVLYVAPWRRSSCWRRRPTTNFLPLAVQTDKLMFIHQV